MADTIRTLADLSQNVFPDNVDGLISPQSIRDLVVSMMVHGEIGSLAKSQIVLGTGFQALDFNQAGAVSRGLTLDTANKWIGNIPVAMSAEVTLEVTFQGSNNTTFDFGVFRDSGAGFAAVSRLQDSERLFNAAMVGGVRISSALDLQAGDKLQAGVRANGANFTLLRGVLRVRRIGVE